MKTLETTITKKLNLIFYKIRFQSTPKMGGIKKLTCNSISISVDNTEFYKGRGEKYNSNINHSFEEIVITQKTMNDLVREEKLMLKTRNLIKLANEKSGYSGSLSNLNIKTNNFYVHHSFGSPLQLIFRKNDMVTAIDFTDKVKAFCDKKDINYVNTNCFYIMQEFNLDPSLMSGQLFERKNF